MPQVEYLSWLEQWSNRDYRPRPPSGGKSGLKKRLSSDEALWRQIGAGDVFVYNIGIADLPEGPFRLGVNRINMNGVRPS